MPRWFLAPALALLFAVCLVVHETRAQDHVSPVLVGMVYSMAQDDAAVSSEGRNGMRLAVALANRAGGVGKRPVKIIEKTPSGGILETSRAMAQLDKAGVFGVAGFDNDSLAQTAAPAAQGFRIPMVFAGVTLEKDVMDGEYTFMASFTNTAQARALAALAWDKLAYDAVIILDPDTDSNADLAKRLEPAYQAKGGKLLEELMLINGGSNLKAMVDRLKRYEQPPSGFFLIAGPKVAEKTVKALRGAGFDQAIFAPESTDVPGFAKALGPDGRNVIHTVQACYDIPDKQTRLFAELYKKEFGQRPETGFAAIGFDAMTILLQAAMRSGGTDRDRIRQELARTINYVGPAGKISYAPGRNYPDKQVPAKSLSGAGEYLGTF